MPVKGRGLTGKGHERGGWWYPPKFWFNWSGMGSDHQYVFLNSQVILMCSQHWEPVCRPLSPRFSWSLIFGHYQPPSTLNAHDTENLHNTTFCHIEPLSLAAPKCVSHVSPVIQRRHARKHLNETLRSRLEEWKVIRADRNFREHLD